MANYYPTLVRGRSATGFQGAGSRALLAPTVERRPYPRSGELFPGIPVGYPDKFRGPSIPKPPFGRKAVAAPEVPRQAARIAGLARSLIPGAGQVLANHFAMSSVEYVNAESVTSTNLYGAGFRIAAQCPGGGAPARLYNTSVIYPFTNPGPINSCLVSSAYFPGEAISETTRSFALVEPRPRPGLEWNAKGVIAWHRPLAGPVNQRGAIIIQPRHEAWVDLPVSPAIMPYAFPLLSPLAVPAGQEITQPMTWEQVEALNGQIGRNPWVQREVHPSLRLGRARAAAPGGAEPVPINAVPAIEFRGGTRPPVVGEAHVNAKPPPGAKERKLKSKWGAVAARIGFNAITELGDFVGALHDALPKDLRRSRTWRGKDGKWHKRRLDSMLRDLYNGWEHLDLNMAINNVLANSVEDYVIGRTNQTLNRASQSSGSGFAKQMDNVAAATGNSSLAQALAGLAADYTFKAQKNQSRSY